MRSPKIRTSPPNRPASIPNGASSSAREPSAGVATIAALATAPGTGAIAIVRASGPLVRAFLGTVVRTAKPLRERIATNARIVAADGTLIDEGLALLFPGPRSYTGEDVLELHVHGSPAVAAAALQALFAAGARLAGPGEFTRRALEAGKIDVARAEAIGELIAAEHRSAARAAAAGLGGGLAGEVDRVRLALEQILDALAASLDFPDEVETPPASELRATLEACLTSLCALGSSWERGRLVREGVAVTVAGAANAGKSSLFNALLGVERALVSDTPGTTRDTIEERVALPGGMVARITDSAGMRSLGETAARSLEAAGIERSHAALAGATIALVVVDASVPLSRDAANVLEQTRARPRLVFYNKADLGRVAFDQRAAQEAEAMLGSALDPATPPRVTAALADLALLGETPDLARPHLATARQADAAARAEQSLRLALDSLDAGQPADLLATDLTNALAALDELIGRDVTEAMLDRIFARFCIGK